MSGDARKVLAGYALVMEQCVTTTEQVCYLFHSLTNAELVIDTTQLWCLGTTRVGLPPNPHLTSTRCTFRTGHISLKWIRSLPDACRKLSQRHLRISEFDIDVVDQPVLKQAAAETLSGLCTNSNETTHRDGDISNCSFGNMQMTNDETPSVHDCTKCEAQSDLIRGRTDKNLIEKGETRLRTVQPAGCRSTNRDVQTIKGFNVEHTKQAYCRKVL